ncbi:MAG TPA: hypothetical protein VHC98_00475 [Candidatus Saccharimonadales bacterium]|nr:hypothetical protein [Candidatus Saccharimonadales bacterium]
MPVAPGVLFEADRLEDPIEQVLVVPHPRKRQRREAQTLYDYMRLDEARSYLETATETMDPDELGQTRLGMALCTAQAVSEALWFTEDKKLPVVNGEPLPPSTSDIRAKQLTDCYGYARTASGILRYLGIPHWIGHPEDHATLIVPVGSGENFTMWMVDPLTPSLSTDLHGKVLDADMRQAQASLERGERHAVFMQTKYMRDWKVPAADIDSLAADHPWLAAEKQTYAVGFNGRRRQSRTQIVMALYPPEDAWRVMEMKNNFDRARVAGDLVSAAGHLTLMRGEYPLIDVRSKDYSTMKQFFRRLLDRELYIEAWEAMDSYFDSFVGVTGDSRVYERRGDAFRSLARAALATAMGLGGEGNVTLQDIAARAAAEAELSYQAYQGWEGDHRRPAWLSEVFKRKATIAQAIGQTAAAFSAL